MNIRKRYSEFDDFRHRLRQSFPSFEAAVPVLPPKSVISKFRPNFLEKRRAGLQYFLKYVAASHFPLPFFFFWSCHLTGFRLCSCILLNPEFSGSPVLKEFLFA